MRLASLLLFTSIIGITQPNVSGQDTPATIKPLTIGDTVPDVVLENIINYPKSSARLSDFKDKLLLLDFWATWCSNCIYAIPKLDSLQKKFRNELQVMMVTSQSSSQALGFINRYRKNKAQSIPSVTADSLLSQLFPHGTIPHNVWIGADGRVLAITSAKYVTDENIARVLRGESVKLPLKKELLDYDSHLPLFVNGNGGDGPFFCKTTLAGYIPGLSRRASTSVDNGYQKFTAVNQPLLQLFEFALETNFNNRLVYEGAAHSALFADAVSEDEWYRRNSYSYEIIAPKDVEVVRLRKKMLADLEEHFRLNCTREKRWMTCYVITRAKGIQSLPLVKGGKTTIIDSERQNVKQFYNLPLSALVNLLNRKQPWSIDNKPIFLDETGLTANPDLSIKASILHNTDVNQLKIDLAEQGFVLSEAKRLIEVIVIRPTND